MFFKFRYKLILLKTAAFVYFVLTLFAATAQTINEDKKLKFSISVFSCNSLFESGYVQVREHSFSGSHLNLNNDLGLKHWLRPGFNLSATIKKKNKFSFTYTESLFSGSKYLKNYTWYNGTLLVANSKADIKNSLYRSYDFVWLARINHKENYDLFLRAGVLYERLKFYVDATIADNSPIRETFEKFWKQQQPLPSVGVAAVYRLTNKLLLNGDVSFIYLPKVKTWMNEGGTISLKQSNADANIALNYNFKTTEFESGIWFKHFKLLEESDEDTNNFLLNSFGYKISISYSF